MRYAISKRISAKISIKILQLGTHRTACLSGKHCENDDCHVVRHLSEDYESFHIKRDLKQVVCAFLSIIFQILSQLKILYFFIPHLTLFLENNIKNVQFYFLRMYHLRQALQLNTSVLLHCQNSPGSEES